MKIIKSIGAAVKGIFAAAVPALLAWGKTEAEKALAAVKNSPTGSVIKAAVDAAEASGKSGPEKMAGVLAAAMPLVLALATKGGRQAELAEVETLTRSVVESIVADLKQTSIATAVLAALGLQG